MDSLWDTKDYLYMSPFARIGPYLIGLAAAYLFVRINYKWNANKVSFFFNCKKGPSAVLYIQYNFCL